MLKPLSLLLILAGLALGPVYWIYVQQFTGKLVQTLQLEEADGGTWTSPALRLRPDMRPAGLILRVSGSFSPNMPDDQPPVDRYRAVLRQDGVAAAPIPIELNAGTVTNTHPQFRERLALLKSPGIGEYQLLLAPEDAPRIRLDGVQLEIRSGVLEPDHRVVATGIVLLAIGVLGLLM